MTSNTQNQSAAKSPEPSSIEQSESLKALNEIPSATTSDIPEFGWSSYAERINGRFAMIGFTAILLIEAISNDSFLHWAGIIP